MVARKKPMVAITHIGGQEDGNIEVIKKKGFGVGKRKSRGRRRIFRWSVFGGPKILSAEI